MILFPQALSQTHHGTWRGGGSEHLKQQKIWKTFFKEAGPFAEAVNILAEKAALDLQTSSCLVFFFPSKQSFGMQPVAE